MRALVAELHDREAGERAARRAALAALASHTAKRFPVRMRAGRAPHRFSIPARLDEVGATSSRSALGVARLGEPMVIRRGGVIARLCHFSAPRPAWTTCATTRLQHSCEKKGSCMELVDRPQSQSSAATSRTRSSRGPRLTRPPSWRVSAGWRSPPRELLSPGFAQDVLGALPDERRASARSRQRRRRSPQWQRNALYEPTPSAG